MTVQRAVHYEQGTGKILGYYSDDVHDIIPEPYLLLTEEQYRGGLAVNANYVDLANGILVYQEVVDLAELAEFNRHWRDEELLFTDRFMLEDFPLSPANKAEVLAYRSALRDYPNDSISPTEWVRPVRPTFMN